MLAIVASIVVFWAIGSGGYRIVLAVEGTTQVSVNYWSFAAPLLAWIGIGLLAYRLADLTLRRGRGLVACAARPSRRARRHCRGEHDSPTDSDRARRRARHPRNVLRRVSTAAFNTTYLRSRPRPTHDSRTAQTSSSPRPRVRRSQPGWSPQSRASPTASRALEPLQHRYAYIGNDLQDLYGVNATTVVHGARLQDAWFAGGSAAQLFGRLARTPDGILLSEEVVHDYQLHPGDHIKTPPAQPAHARSDSSPIHVPRGHQGVPDRPQGRLHDRQRGLRLARDTRARGGRSPDPDRRRLARRRGRRDGPARWTRGHGDYHRDEPQGRRQQPHERRTRRPDTRRARLRARTRRSRNRPAALAQPRRAPPHVRHRAGARRAPTTSSQASSGPRPAS